MHWEPKQILEIYADMVYQLALVQMKNKPDAEDIFQDVFLRLVKSNPNLDSEEHLKAWLIRVTLNCCKSQWRSPWRKKTLPLEEEILSMENGQKPEMDVYMTVLSLPKRERILIQMFYYEDMSLEEISKLLGIRYNAAAQRLSRARKKLKQLLLEEETEDQHEKLSESV